MRALVTGANGDIGDAAARVLREGLGAEVHGSDLGPVWPARDVCDVVHVLPRADDPAYPDALAALVRRHELDLVVPTSEPEIERLATDPGTAAGLPALVLPAAVVRVFLDKLETARWLEAHGLDAPRTVPLEEATPDDLPVVVKPRRGAGGRGVVVVRTPERLALEQAEREEPAVAQALLDDERSETTCAVARLDGELRVLQLRRRLASGVTVAAEVIDDPDVHQLVGAVAAAADLDGCLNVQLRSTSEGPRIFEVNPRLSSTLKLRHEVGFQDLVWWVRRLEGRRPPPYAPVPGTLLFRLAREVVVAP